MGLFTIHASRWPQASRKIPVACRRCGLKASQALQLRKKRCRRFASLDKNCIWAGRKWYEPVADRLRAGRSWNQAINIRRRSASSQRDFASNIGALELQLFPKRRLCSGLSLSSATVVNPAIGLDEGSRRLDDLSTIKLG